MPRVWHTLPQQLQLKLDEVHLIGAALTQSDAVAANLRLLSAAEQKRAARFKFTIHREQFILAHGYLRQILARYCKESAAQITFKFGAKGKPFLAEHPGVQFNLSHSQNQMLLAVSADHEIGVDIEQIKTCQVLNLAQRFFSELEYQQLEALNGAELLTAFYQIWAQKEAYIKATGLGLSTELRQFSVQAMPAGLLHPNDPIWTIQTFEWLPDFAGAYAIRCKPKQVHYWKFLE